MESIVKFLLGIQEFPWADEGKGSLEWASVPSGDGLFLLLAAAVAGIAGLCLLYRWEAGRLPLAARLSLTAIRVVLLGLVLLMLMEPVLVYRGKEWLPSHLPVLVDQSPSMELRDGWRDTAAAEAVAQVLDMPGEVEAMRRLNRLELAQRWLNTNRLNDLKAGGDRILHFHTFAESLNAETEAADWKPQTGGQSTAIGEAVRQALRNYRGLPLAGILVLSDGQSNAGESIYSAAKAAEDVGAPIVAVGIGTRSGPSNARLSPIEADPVAFVRDVNRVSVDVHSNGMDGVPVTVRFESRWNGGDWRHMADRDLLLQSEGPMQTVSHEYRELRPGRLEIRASIDNAGPELTQDDNVSLADVRVIRQTMRVLFIAGSTFPEVQFLRNALLRDTRIESSTWLMNAAADYSHPGDAPIRRLPVTQEELNEFDCLVLYDPDPNGWASNFSQMILDFAAKAGGGLIYVAGEMHTAGLFDRQSDPTLKWLSLLPVVREPGLFRSRVQMRLSAQSAWKLSLTDEGRRHTVFAFSEDAETNERILDNLPGMFWHFPVTRAKPGATVLAHHGDPRMRNEFGPEVLMASHLVGPGRVFFVGFDSTYRWRYLDDQFFDGFWARMIDRAGRNKQLGGEYPFRLSTDRPNYEPGETIKITARFSNDEDIGAGVRQLHGEAEAGREAPVPIALDPGDDPLEFAAEFMTSRSGPHTFRVWTGDRESGALVNPSTIRVNVELPNREYATPGMDAASLETLASMTGGKAFQLAQANDAASAFQVRRVARILENRQEIWDAPLFYGAFMILLTAEWLLRKRCRLI